MSQKMLGYAQEILAALGTLFIQWPLDSHCSHVKPRDSQTLLPKNLKYLENLWTRILCKYAEIHSKHEINFE